MRRAVRLQVTVTLQPDSGSYLFATPTAQVWLNSDDSATHVSIWGVPYLGVRRHWQSPLPSCQISLVHTFS